ncbi:MAG: sugar ABC transporter ATP-binding protein [Actinobacteria bacterium]|nr:sugar ABC transporter ATP-binding protein [Actinomycetota bacterium]
MSAADVPALQIRGLSKLFAGQRALDDVDLEIGRGETHALVGANGSGKSTLIKVLAGYHRPEPGAEILIDGEPLDTGNPAASEAAGLRFIHQDLGLIGTLSVAENLELGGSYPGGIWLSDRAERRNAKRLLDTYGIEADPAALVDSLRPTQQTLLAIARTVGEGLDAGNLLILDEPTATLPAEEVRHLHAILDRLKARGVTILYVTHRLTEIFDIAARVTVLRDGRRVATTAVADLDQDRLVELILGQRLAVAEFAAREVGVGELLEVSGLHGGGVHGADFAARPGEIVGLTGLMGSGYEEALGLVFGARPREAGTVTLEGREVRGGPKAAIRAGLAFAPAERRRYGAIVEWSLRENLTLPKITGAGPLRWLGDRAEAREARGWLERLTVKPTDPEQRFMALSGGNQQKVVLARWLRCGARAFLLDEPTFGVDAGAKRAIYTELRAAAEDGAAVIVSSSDTEELCELCDRVLVMGDGIVKSEMAEPFSPDDVFAATLRASRGAAGAGAARSASG